MSSDFLSPLRELTFFSMVLRLLLSMFFGGMIGMERERKRRPAGFRTYMLVCLGAAMTMILSQYLYTMLQGQWSHLTISIDFSRLGAQVINGIGFLGAGTILVTGHQAVKGLTTAAGLWSSACMGLAIGAGFYECVIPGTLFMLLSILFLPHLERLLVANGKHMSIYVEFCSMKDLGAVLLLLRSLGIHIYDVDMAHISDTGAHPNAVLTLLLPTSQSHTVILARISKLDNIFTLEEL